MDRTVGLKTVATNDYVQNKCSTCKINQFRSFPYDCYFPLPENISYNCRTHLASIPSILEC
jgi:hypothetical protein